MSRFDLFLGVTILLGVIFFYVLPLVHVIFKIEQTYLFVGFLIFCIYAYYDVLSKK